jgi:hypothetical protein
MWAPCGQATGPRKQQNGLAKHLLQAALPLYWLRKRKPTNDEMTELTLEILRAELAPIHTRLGTIEARVAGLPLIGAAIETLRQDVRMLRTAINDMARVNITAGEVEALHFDIDRVQAENMELATRLATVERLLEELRQ